MCLDRLFLQFLFAAGAAASAAVNARSGGREVLAVLLAMLTAECRLAFGCTLGFRKTERVGDVAADCIPSAAMLFNLLVRSRRAFTGSCKFATDLICVRQKMSKMLSNELFTTIRHEIWILCYICFRRYAACTKGPILTYHGYTYEQVAGLRSSAERVEKAPLRHSLQTCRNFTASILRRLKCL